MAWLRVALLPSLALTLGCTLANPAFDDEVGDGASSETRGESDAGTTLGESSSSSAESTSADTSSATDASTSTASTTDASTTGDPPTDLPDPNACPDPLREGLQLLFGNPILIDNACPDTVDMHGRLTFNPLLQTLVFSRCADLDTNCLGVCAINHPIDLGFDLTGLTNTCVHVQTNKPIEDLGDVCSWGAIAMYTGGNVDAPLVIANTFGVDPPAKAKQLLAGFPTLEKLVPCTCEAFGIAETCCTEGGEISFFEFQLPDQSTAAPGETVSFQLGAQADAYMFDAVQAQSIGTCSSYAEVETSWMIRKNF